MFKFGTDGYRAIIGSGFDFKTVGELTKALCSYLKTTKDKPYIIIGYDTRFLSDKFAAFSADVALEEGLKVELTQNFVPTPMLSYAVVNQEADSGIVITASHNPYYYNGFKIKNAQGGSASPAQINALKPFLKDNVEIPKHNFHSKPKCDLIDPSIAYFKHIETIIDKGKFAKTQYKVVVDPMYGSGQGYFKQILDKYNLQTIEIHNEINLAFGGLQPEPISENLKPLREAVLNNGADIGLALDGDADRSGIFDEQGNFINSHQIFALLLYHLVENKKLKGLVVKTFSTTSLIDSMAEHYGLKVKQTPVGFKHISDYMLKENVLIGGEESGGIGLKGHIPERDGILIGLMMLELMAETGKKLSDLIAYLYSRFGNFSYNRIDKIIQPEVRQSLYKNLQNTDISQLVNKSVKNTMNEDGCKFEFSDRSWLMFRLSGTESVVRIYAEAHSKDEVKKLLEQGNNLVASLTR